MDKTDIRANEKGCVMTIETVNVYEKAGVARPEKAAGNLTCWIPDTQAELNCVRQRPALLLLPGGAYAWCSPREAEPVALRFTAAGYAVFSLTYSCAPFRYPVALREAAMAMCYLRSHAEELGIDPGQIAALGFSAGGHLCGTLGMLYDAPEVSDLGRPEQIRPDALILCYPVAVSHGRTHDLSFLNLTGGESDLAARLSLDSLVRPDMPPVFLWHTRDDESVPCRNSIVLAQHLEEAGVDFVLSIYGHGRHGLSTADDAAYASFAVPQVSKDVPGWPGAVLDFLREHGFAIRDRGRDR